MQNLEIINLQSQKRKFGKETGISNDVLEASQIFTQVKQSRGEQINQTKGPYRGYGEYEERAGRN